MKISKRFSFDGFKVWTFIKGQRKTIVTIFTSIVALFVSDSATSALIAGTIASGLFSAAEFYFSEVKLK